jgi:hypothetical protein
MVLMMVNNRAKNAMKEKAMESEEEDSGEGVETHEQAKAKELNNLIKQMSVKLPRSECDEYESHEASGDSTTKTINNKYCFSQVNQRFNLMNNTKNRNSRSVSQEKEIYSDLTENDVHESIHMSSKEKLSSKPYSYKNKSFKGSLDHKNSNSYKFRKKNKSRTQQMISRMGEYGMTGQQDIIMEQYHDHQRGYRRRSSRLVPEDLDDFTDDDFYDEDMEEVCAIHRKELDMVCLQSECETPVCSKCILVGDHKNHKYVEKENFFKNLDIEKQQVLQLQGEIENSEQLLMKNNSSQLILERVAEQRDHFKKQLDAHCNKILKAVESRRTEVEREIQIYFEQLGEKLGNYVSETVDATQANKEWKTQLDDALRELTENECDIESGFNFRKMNKRLKFEENSKRIISNIGELQNLIDKKLKESLTSFDLEMKDVSRDFIEIAKNEVSFKQDLRERMRIVYNKEMEPKKAKEGMNMMNNQFKNMVEEYQGNLNRDTDLMNDDMDPSAGNLMVDLPEFGMKTQKNNMFNRTITPNSANMLNSQQFGFRKNQNMMEPPTNPLNNGRVRSSMYMNNNDGDAFYSQSSMNNVIQHDFLKNDNRSRSITKNSQNRQNKEAPNDLSKCFAEVTPEMNNFGKQGQEIVFNNKRQPQPRISMPQLNINPSMMQPGNFNTQFPNYMTNNPGNFGNQGNNLTSRHGMASARNLDNFQNRNLGMDNLANYRSTANFGNTFGGVPNGKFMGNQTNRYPPDYFASNKNSDSDSKKLLKSKSQKRKIMKKGSTQTKKGRGKTKNQALNSLEVKFGALLTELKEDTIVDMNMENANISDLEVRALGPILAQSKKLRKISFKRNNISDRGVGYLCKSLATSNLEFLDLSYNKISPKSFGDFKKYKLKNSKIRCIVLRNNDIPSSMKRKRNIEFQKIGLNFDF